MNDARAGVRRFQFVSIMLFALLAALAPATAAWAQLPGGFGGSRHVQQSQARLSAELVVYEGEIVAGRQATIGVVMQTQDGWKIQAGEGSGDHEPPYIATTIDLDVPDGWTVGRYLWPDAKTFTVGEGVGETSANGYEGRFIAVTHVDVPSDAAGQSVTLKATVGYQPCDDTLCERPTSLTVERTFDVRAEPSMPPPVIDSEISALFTPVLARAQDSAAQSGGDSGGDAGEPSEGVTSGVQADSTTEPDAAVFRPSFFGWTLPRTDGPFGLILLALLSMVGGFVLNLTPCVLPVIPIKIMTIQKHADSPGKSLALGMWMAIGVVAFWIGIGLPVAFVSGVTDPSRLFGIWWLTLSIGVLIALMGIGIMGMFSINLPQSVYAVNPRADSAWGSFLFGIMTGVLGLPCFGFVAGALLAGAAVMPASTIMIIFASLGVGMAAPYLVFAAKPGLVEKLPRTGPASDLVKQVMGLLLLAAAAYFVGAGLIALVSEFPYMARQLHWWAVAIFAALAGLWLIIRTFQITSHIGPRVSFLVIGLLVSTSAMAFAMDNTHKAHETWEVRRAAMANGATDGYVQGIWNDYTPEALATARADGHIVVLDFTAEWCLNCKALKASVLERDPVKSALASDDVVNFTVDLTSTKDPGWVFLEKLGQTGIPLLVIYTPGDDEPWQANAYTPQQVLAALEQARNGREDAAVVRR